MCFIHIVREPNVYSLDDERKFSALFGSDQSKGGNRSSSASSADGELDDMAKQVCVCVCVCVL
jgi:syntaxin-binding protein 1